MTYDPVVALGLLTEHDLSLLGPAFDRVWPVDETACFSGLLRAIDKADRDRALEQDQPADLQ